MKLFSAVLFALLLTQQAFAEPNHFTFKTYTCRTTMPDGAIYHSELFFGFDKDSKVSQGKGSIVFWTEMNQKETLKLLIDDVAFSFEKNQDGVECLLNTDFLIEQNGRIKFELQINNCKKSPILSGVAKAHGTVEGKVHSVTAPVVCRMP